MMPIRVFALHSFFSRALLLDKCLCHLHVLYRRDTGWAEISSGRRWGPQCATDTTIKRELDHTYGIDDYSGRVGRIPDLQFEFRVEWHIAKGTTLKANIGPFTVGKPRDIVGRADMHILFAQYRSLTGWLPRWFC